MSQKHDIPTTEDGPSDPSAKRHCADDSADDNEEYTTESHIVQTEFAKFLADIENEVARGAAIAGDRGHAEKLIPPTEQEEELLLDADDDEGAVGDVAKDDMETLTYYVVMHTVFVDDFRRGASNASTTDCALFSDEQSAFYQAAYLKAVVVVDCLYAAREVRETYRGVDAATDEILDAVEAFKPDEKKDNTDIMIEVINMKKQSVDKLLDDCKRLDDLYDAANQGAYAFRKHEILMVRKILNATVPISGWPKYSGHTQK